MIGDGWDGDPSLRPGETPQDPARSPRRVMVVTGSRAEFGLLTPVMHAIQNHPQLELLVVAAGSHLIPPALTFRDVKALFHVSDSVPMQEPGRQTRLDDAQAVGKGISRFTRTLAGHQPDWVVVLGDRIEAFAAASAASIAGFAVAHLHGGDRAEGIADEAMRHAITKLAHLHLPATQVSAARIRQMGEPSKRIVVVGSPAIDTLDAIEPMSDEQLTKHIGSTRVPDAVVLMHPAGRDPETEEAVTAAMLEALGDRVVVALHPNHDPGREGVLRALQAASEPTGKSTTPIKVVPHLVREHFVGLLKRVAQSGGVLIGNSSAGLIEAAALKIPVVNIGPRQAGRERPGHVVDAAHETVDAIGGALVRARALDLSKLSHPYGDGRAGVRTAAALASVDPHNQSLLRKRFVDATDGR